MVWGAVGLGKQWCGVSRQWCGVGASSGVVWGKQTVVWGGVSRQWCGVG